MSGSARGVSVRAREMIARLERSWPDAGIPTPECEDLVDRAHAVMEARSSRFSDDHHPAFLHPLRTAVLLLEAGETDPRAHHVALELDTEAPDHDPEGDPAREPAPAGGAVPEFGDEQVSDLVAARSDERLELLVLSDRWLLHTWLAERLDQIRHIHLWAGPERTRAALVRGAREEAPLARRVGGRLDRAWSDWLEKAERYRLVDRAETRPIGVPNRP